MRSPERSTAPRLALAALLTLLVGCDHATKFAAKAELQGHHPRELIHGVLELHVLATDISEGMSRWRWRSPGA